MNKKILMLVILITLVSLAVFVSARMTFLYEDDGLYNIYETEIMLEKGWNLVSFSGELAEDSEIQRQDIKAIFYYNFITNKYIQRYPENPEFNELVNQDTCGDGSCSVDERVDYASWCASDCYYNINEDIVSNLNVISEKNILLEKGEKITIDFINNADMEVYFDEDHNGENFDLYHNTIGGGGGSMGICRNYDAEINLLRTYGEDESKIYVKVDCSDDKKSFTFYEIDDVKVNPDEVLIPSIGARIITQPAWVYSEKRGLLKMEDDISIVLSKNELKYGWNFVTITPDFTSPLNQMKGDCNIQKAYMYDAENQEWLNLENYMGEERMLGENSAQGQGLVIKVTDSCYMGGSGSSTTPPELPRDSETCTDTDGGLDYYVKGTVTGQNEDAPIKEITSATDTCDGDTLYEWICKNSEEYDDEAYICPNGCSDGVCI